MRWGTVYYHAEEVGGGRSKWEWGNSASGSSSKKEKGLVYGVSGHGVKGEGKKEKGDKTYITGKGVGASFAKLKRGPSDDDGT